MIWRAFSLIAIQNISWCELWILLTLMDSVNLWIFFDNLCWIVDSQNWEIFYIWYLNARFLKGFQGLLASFLNEYQNFLTESITLNYNDTECHSHLSKSYDLIINFYGICLMLVALNHLNNTQSQIHLSIPTPW